MSVLRFICVLLLFCLAARQDGIGGQLFVIKGPRFAKRPIVYRNPNSSAPLAAIIEFAADRPARAKLILKEAGGERLLVETDSYRRQFVLPVVGMRPGRKNRIQVRLADSTGNEITSTELNFTTDPLPPDFPPIRASMSGLSRAEPGMRLFGVIQTGVLTNGLLVAVDTHGEVVWYFRWNESISDVRRLQNGNVLFMTPTGVVEINILGNVVQLWNPRKHSFPMGATPVDLDIFHHEFYETTLKTFLTLGTELRRLPSYPASEFDTNAEPATADVVGDVVAEVRRDGTIIHFWKLLDILDPYRISFDSLSGFWNREYPDARGGTKDWSHANAVVEDTSDDSLILSLRHQDAIVKLDRRSGALVWILGDPDDWKLPWSRYLLAPDGELQWPYHQHGSTITPQGNILLFDNGNRRRRPFDGRSDNNYSRAVEYAVDTERMAVSEVWSYGWPRDEYFFSDVLGYARMLPRTGNVLITDGARFSAEMPLRRWARIVEVTHESPPEKVFELTIQDPPGPGARDWFVYRAIHLPSLYPDAVH
jgi:arylsulfate sulfotransferase